MDKKYVDIDYISEQVEEAQMSLLTDDDKLWGHNKPYFKGLAWANAIISEAPAADVEEVRHGEWVEQIEESYWPGEFDKNGDLILHKYTHYKCNLCARTVGKKEPYCHCGAKMDGGKE